MQRLSLINKKIAGQSPVSLIVKLAVKQEKLDSVRSMLKKMVEPTRAEQGCIQYDILENVNDKTVFFVKEQWKNKACLKKHAKSPHAEEFKKITENGFEEMQINFVKQI